MVFNVRCFKCGEQEVRLVLGGRSILHARCHSCDSNLLAEIMELEEEVEARQENEEYQEPAVESPSAQQIPKITSELVEDTVAQTGN